jgi:hypothetical protein
MHGKTVGKALFARLAKQPKRVLDDINDERVQGAILWGSEYRFWSNDYETKLGAFFSKPALQRNPIFAAARLNAYFKERHPWGVEKYRDMGPLLREAAQSERNAYYRHWYIELADELDDMLARNSSRFSGFPFGDLFGNNGDDEDEDNNLGLDPSCDCPDCQAARRAKEQV